MRRIGIFVDGANVYYCQRDNLGWWIDWRRFIEYHRLRYEVVEARYYRALRGEGLGDDETAFGKVLTSNGYVLREKRLKEVFDKYTGAWIRKGNLDVELALDAYGLATRFDVCLLVSGDGDFVALVERLRQLGKAVIVASTRGSLALELRETAGPDFMDLRRCGAQFARHDMHRRPILAPRRNRRLGEGAKYPGPVTEAPLGTTPVPSAMTFDSPYKVGEQFSATVKLINKDGAVVVDQNMVPAYLPAAGLRLTAPGSGTAALMQAGDEFVVSVVELRPGRSRAVLMVELADATSRTMLEARLASLSRTIAADSESS